MSLQVYKGDQADQSAELAGALVTLPNGLQITEEEQEKRMRDAEVLEEKLKFITENVPTRIMNISGSNAGAGSGEFHMYRMARRREQMRLQRLDEEQEREDADQAFQERKRKQEEEDAARTAKRRAQRQKKKDKNKGAKKNIDGLPEARAVKSADEEKQEDTHIPDLD